MKKKVLDRIRKISEDVTSYDLNKIYVCEKIMKIYLCLMCRNWSILRDSIKAFIRKIQQEVAQEKKKR